MATAVSSLARIRSAAVSARGFQTAALVTLALLWLVVTTGGLVRLTASGLGCPHWPTCEASQLVPSASYHAVIEYTNRVISGVAMLAAVATAIMAYRVPGLNRGVARAAALAAAGTVAQVPLGAITVAFDLHPLLVMSHFLLAMAVVAASTWVTFRAWRLAHGGEPRPLDVPRVGVAAWAAVAACLVLVTTGAFVTAAGPHAGSTDKPIERLGDFHDAAWVHVRAAVIFSTLFLIVAVWLWRKARGVGAAAAVRRRRRAHAVPARGRRVPVPQRSAVGRDRRARCHRRDAGGHGRHRCGAHTRFCRLDPPSGGGLIGAASGH